MGSISKDDDGGRGAATLNVHIVGAGLGGLGAAIAILLAGHNVTVLEAAATIEEVGAGIQVLPNAARVLSSWGLEATLDKLATKPGKATMSSWKGELLGEMDLAGYAKVVGAGPFWDLHRADVQKCLLERATALGAKVITGTKVSGFAVSEVAEEEEGESSTTVAELLLADGTRITTDLIIAADGINSTLREVFLSRPDPPQMTGDLAYRLLIPAAEMRKDPDLQPLVANPQVDYWLGPGKHAVVYMVKGGQLANLVLLVPDDIPVNGAHKIRGDIEEMRAHFADWDPRIGKMLRLCHSVVKWRLCSRSGMDTSWSNPSGTFAMLGDAIHATLPYLASGAGMALEDGGVLGLCLARLSDKSAASKRRALAVYEACRRDRTDAVGQKGIINQHVYHLPDGPEQRDRDQRFRKYTEWEKQWLSQDKPRLDVSTETGDDPFPFRYHGVGRWLLTYDMESNVEEEWQKSMRA